MLEAAREVFAESGIAAPGQEIADRAGVGIGTMYRHFPRRSDLVAAVLTSEIDACAAAAATLAEENPPARALTKWMQRYTELVATKRGLAAALHSDDDAFQGLAPYVRERLEPALQLLLDAAVEGGLSRPRLDAGDVIIAVALLCQPVPDKGITFNEHLVAVFLEGLFPVPAEGGERRSTS
nr:TetR/AcrR family transcriptional regulator [Arthrobacter sp. zg-Y40]